MIIIVHLKMIMCGMGGILDKLRIKSQKFINLMIGEFRLLNMERNNGNIVL